MLSGFENPIHILMLLVVVLLLFGAKRLPESGRSLGTGLREFKTSITGAATDPTHAAAPVSVPQSVGVPEPARVPVREEH